MDSDATSTKISMNVLNDTHPNSGDKHFLWVYSEVSDKEDNVIALFEHVLNKQLPKLDVVDGQKTVLLFCADLKQLWQLLGFYLLVFDIVVPAVPVPGFPSPYRIPISTCDIGRERSVHPRTLSVIRYHFSYYTANLFSGMPVTWGLYPCPYCLIHCYEMSNMSRAERGPVEVRTYKDTLRLHKQNHEYVQNLYIL